MRKRPPWTPPTTTHPNLRRSPSCSLPPPLEGPRSLLEDLGPATKRRGRRDFSFVDIQTKGRMNLQAAYVRATEQGATEEEAKAAVQRRKAELRDEERRGIREAMRAQEERGAADQAARAAEEQRQREIDRQQQLEERRARMREPPPMLEWWDQRLLDPVMTTYYDPQPFSTAARSWPFRKDRITHYVEHPVPTQPPYEAPPPPPQPLKLTAKEVKKLRTQRRVAREHERQELVRKGVIEPPKPKVKLSNLHRVLGLAAAADPTAIEQEVRRQMAEREQEHRERNLASMLTPAERREKKIKKMFDDAPETHVAVFKVPQVRNKRIRFKLSINAEQNHLTGRLVTGFEGRGVPFVLLAVEGCTRSLKRYMTLVQRRVDWNEVLDEEMVEGEEEEDRPDNACVLVWTGTVLEPAFKEFRTYEALDEGMAVQHLAQAGCEHYWAMAGKMDATVTV